MILELEKVAISYNETKVISDATFSVSDDDFICVVGTNGSGKSTLIKAILGLLKHSGKIKLSVPRDEIGYLPQETKVDLNFPATVSEIVFSGTLGRMGFRPFYGAEEKLAAEKAMKKLKVFSLRNKSFSELSGGQKQKVLLARALTASTKLLILDEPSNNLDYDSRRDFYQTLSELNSDGLAIMMITHDLDKEDLIGNKVVAIADGATKTYSTKEYLKEMR